jgi:hypothetical protein
MLDFHEATLLWPAECFLDGSVDIRPTPANTHPPRTNILWYGSYFDTIPD